MIFGAIVLAVLCAILCSAWLIDVHYILALLDLLWNVCSYSAIHELRSDHNLENELLRQEFDNLAKGPLFLDNAEGENVFIISNSVSEYINSGKFILKVKSSNNKNYRVKPVYGFLDAKATSQLEIFRTSGRAKNDKLVIQWVEVPAEETDPQASFKDKTKSGEVILPLKAE